MAGQLASTLTGMESIWMGYSQMYEITQQWESNTSPNLNGSSIPICGVGVRNGISMKVLGVYGPFG